MPSFFTASLLHSTGMATLSELYDLRLEDRRMMETLNRSDSSCARYLSMFRKATSILIPPAQSHQKPPKPAVWPPESISPPVLLETSLPLDAIGDADQGRDWHLLAQHLRENEISPNEALIRIKDEQDLQLLVHHLREKGVSPNEALDWMKGSGHCRSSMRFDTRFAHPTANMVGVPPEVLTAPPVPPRNKLRKHRDSVELPYARPLRTNKGKGKAPAVAEAQPDVEPRPAGWGAYSPQNYTYMGFAELSADPSPPVAGPSGTNKARQSEVEEVVSLSDGDLPSPLPERPRKYRSLYISPDGTRPRPIVLSEVGEAEVDGRNGTAYAASVFDSSDDGDGEYDGDDDASSISSVHVEPDNNDFPPPSRRRREGKVFSKHFSPDGTIRFSMFEDRRDSLPHSFLNTDSTTESGRGSVITTVTELEAQEKRMRFTVVDEDYEDEYAEDYVLPATTFGQPVPEAMYVPIGLDVLTPPQTPTRSSFSSLKSLQLPVIPVIPVISPIRLSFVVEIAA